MRRRRLRAFCHLADRPANRPTKNKRTVPPPSQKHNRLKFVFDPDGTPAADPSKTPAKRKAVRVSSLQHCQCCCGAWDAGVETGRRTKGEG